MAIPYAGSTEFHQKVGATALYVALYRSLEQELHAENPLFHDPYSKVLSGAIESTKIMESSLASKDSSIQWFQELTAIRTRKIDDMMTIALQDHHITQICALGAGVDTRPWRLNSGLSNQQEIPYYEVDFPEIFDYKLPILKANNAIPQFDYRKVEADLSVPSWLEKLEQTGFQREIPTVWLLEGLTGYLTEEELRLLFNRISELSAPGSQLIATFLTPVMLRRSLSLHRYAPEDPLTFVHDYGWSGIQVDIADYAMELGRSTALDEACRGYFLVTVQK